MLLSDVGIVGMTALLMWWARKLSLGEAPSVSDAVPQTCGEGFLTYPTNSLAFSKGSTNHSVQAT